MQRAAPSRLLPVVAVAASLLGACDLPSDGVDGGDLMGIFDRDASTDAAVVTDASADAAPPAPRPAVAARARLTGPCVDVEGRPDRDVRRTAGRPPCRDAEILEWRDGDGSPRYACVYAPRGMSTRAPIPAIVFFHGEEDDPSSVAKKTGLRKLGARLDMTGDPAHAGFLVVAVQGRALRSSKIGLTFDAAYTGADNADVAAADHFLGALAERKLIDPARVYAMGNAGGGHMAATYAMLRPDKVAAFAAYASEPPSAKWQCAGPPPPGVIFYRACDAFVPCTSVESWLRERDGASADTASRRLGADDGEEPSCTVRNKCTSLKGQLHHRRWPKAREEEMLQFLAHHALLAGGGGEP